MISTMSSRLSALVNECFRNLSQMQDLTHGKTFELFKLPAGDMYAGMDVFPLHNPDGRPVTQYVCYLRSVGELIGQVFSTPIVLMAEDGRPEVFHRVAFELCRLEGYVEARRQAAGGPIPGEAQPRRITSEDFGMPFGYQSAAEIRLTAWQAFYNQAIAVDPFKNPPGSRDWRPELFTRVAEGCEAEDEDLKALRTRPFPLRLLGVEVPQIERQLKDLALSGSAFTKIESNDDAIAMTPTGGYIAFRRETAEGQVVGNSSLLPPILVERLKARYMLDSDAELDRFLDLSACKQNDRNIHQVAERLLCCCGGVELPVIPLNLVDPSNTMLARHHNGCMAVLPETMPETAPPPTCDCGAKGDDQHFNFCATKKR